MAEPTADLPPAIEEIRRGALRWLECGRGESALLCLHGISGAAAVWAEFMPAIAARGGRRVLAWDMPGYGGSALLAETTMASLAAAAARLLDAAGIERAVLVGHSLGGMVAVEFAASFPDRLGALVLACTTPAFGVARGPAQQAFLAQRLGVLDAGGSMAELAASVIPAMLGDAAADALRERHCALMSRIPPLSYRAAMQALLGFDRRAALGAIERPALCVAGEKDRVAMPPVMRAMAASLPAGRYAEIAGAGHLAPFEMPSKFAALVDAFLAERG